MSCYLIQTKLISYAYSESFSDSISYRNFFCQLFTVEAVLERRPLALRLPDLDSRGAITQPRFGYEYDGLSFTLRLFLADHIMGGS